MKKAIVLNARWAGNGKAIVNLSNGQTVWLSVAQLQGFGISVPQAMVGGELSYRFMAIGEQLISGGVVTKADTLLDINSVSFFSEELTTQAFEANAELFKSQAKAQLTEASDLRSKNRTALMARMQAAKNAGNANANGTTTPPAGATPANAGKEPLALDEKAVKDAGNANASNAGAPSGQPANAVVLDEQGKGEE